MADEKTLTTRNLIDADVGPLRKFTGILDSTPTEKKTYGEGDKARDTTQVALQFKDIEVIEAIEPYHFPIFTVNMGISNRKKSKWGVFGDGTPQDRTLGLNNILDQQYTVEQLDAKSPNFVKQSDRPSIKDCIGKRIGLVMADGENGRPEKPELFDGRASKDVPTAAWTVYMIEGIGSSGASGITPMDRAMQLLDGKTLADFNTAALADPMIRADSTLLQAIAAPPSAKNNFANTMITAKTFTVDANKVYHKVT